MGLEGFPKRAGCHVMAGCIMRVGARGYECEERGGRKRQIFLAAMWKVADLQAHNSSHRKAHCELVDQLFSNGRNDKVTSN